MRKKTFECFALRSISTPIPILLRVSFISLSLATLSYSLLIYRSSLPFPPPAILVSYLVCPGKAPLSALHVFRAAFAAKTHKNCRLAAIVGCKLNRRSRSQATYNIHLPLKLEWQSRRGAVTLAVRRWTMALARYIIERVLYAERLVLLWCVHSFTHMHATSFICDAELALLIKPNL